MRESESERERGWREIERERENGMRRPRELNKDTRHKIRKR